MSDFRIYTTDFVVDRPNLPIVAAWLVADCADIVQTAIERIAINAQNGGADAIVGFRISALPHVMTDGQVFELDPDGRWHASVNTNMTVWVSGTAIRFAR
jgi:uncharacterized protein YbjQ (UPF0145 family)